MGDCGSYNASVSVRFSLKRKEKNTEEEALELLKGNKLSIKTSIDANKNEITTQYEAGNRIKLYYKDWDKWDSKDMLEDDMLDAISEYYDADNYSMYKINEATPKDVVDIDFTLIKKYKIRELDSDLTHEVGILNAGEYIYCENDNSSYDSKKVSRIQDLLALPEATLILEADGSGNC